jgi:hypothetical protein
VPGRLENCRQEISYIRIVVDNEQVSHIELFVAGMTGSSLPP